LEVEGERDGIEGKDWEKLGNGERADENRGSGKWSEEKED
jgi:hypothetical protein